MRICLIACSARKLRHRATAQELYTGDLFRRSLNWARRRRPPFDDLAILSGRYGLVRLDEVIETYDDALGSRSQEERRQWGKLVLHQMDLRWQVRSGRGHLTLLAGATYVEPLALHLQIEAPGIQVERPLAGLGIGQQKAWLSKPSN